MRKHGFPQFPDPLTTVPDQPTFTLGRGMYFPVNSTYQAMSPAFMHAAKACGVQLPDLARHSLFGEAGEPEDRSLTSYIDEQHVPAIAGSAKQHEARTQQPLQGGRFQYT